MDFMQDSSPESTFFAGPPSSRLDHLVLLGRKK
jgi:hypothetical protein